MRCEVAALELDGRVELGALFGGECLEALLEGGLDGTDLGVISPFLEQ